LSPHCINEGRTSRRNAFGHVRVTRRETKQEVLMTLNNRLSVAAAYAAMAFVGAIVLGVL
jgi:hypothetical protein